MPRRGRGRSSPSQQSVPGLYTAPYLDSDIFIAWIKGEITEDGINRADVAEHVLLLAEHGYYKVHISSLTLAEVYKPRGYDPLQPTQNQKILDYFEHEFFEMIIVDRDIGLEANRIAAMHGLNPNDTIHTACALRAGCDVLLTWDRRFLSKTVPGIRIEQPEKRGQQLMKLDES